jgi:hypothetical protein
MAFVYSNYLLYEMKCKWENQMKPEQSLEAE